MPAGFIQTRRPRFGGRARQVGQSGRGRFGSRIRFRIGGFEFGIGLRGLLPSIILVSTGGPSTRARPQHPLHGLPFVSPGPLPQVAAILSKAEAAAVFGPAIPAALLAAAGILGLQHVLQEAYLRQLQKELDKQEAELEELRELRRARQDAAEPTIAPVPELLPYYDYPPLPPLIARPTRPVRVDVPAIPQAEPVVLPEISPPRPDIFRPLPPVFPVPVVAPPKVSPVTVPLPFEFPQPGIRPFTWQLPALPFAQPLPIPALPGPGLAPGMPGLGLTPFDVTGLPSRFAAPDTSPKGGTKRGSCECPDTRTKQRKRRQDCAKGFYRERAGKITYTPWAKIDCITGREK
jgi:hypothetical protein